MKTHKYYLKGKNEWVEVVFSVNAEGHIEWPMSSRVSDYRIYEDDKLVAHYPMREGVSSDKYEELMGRV